MHKDNNLSDEKPQYRNPEDLSNSEEEVHPNIDRRSYRKFIKEQRHARLLELRGKESLNENEKRELENLEYKHLPVDRSVWLDSFKTSKDEGEEYRQCVDYTKEFIELYSNNTVKYFVDFMDRRIINLEAFEEFIYLHLIEHIKLENDDIGVEICKMGLLVKWSREFGRSYVSRLIGLEEEVDDLAKSHYQVSKEAIQALQ